VLHIARFPATGPQSCGYKHCVRFRGICNCGSFLLHNCLAVRLLLKNLKPFILKSHGPSPNPKSKLQIPISKLKVPIFSHLHKHELRSLQQRTKLAICQCHCQYYLIECLKCLSELLAAIFTSVVLVYRCCLQLQPVNSTDKTTKH